MNQYRSSETRTQNAKPSLTMNSSSKGGSGFDPELAAKIAALEKQQASQRRCPSCGTVTKTQRLTCENCGNYYDRGIEQTIWDAKQSAAGKPAIETEEEQLVALKSYLVKRIIAKIIDTIIVGSFVAMEFMTYFALVRSFNGMPQFAGLMLAFLYWGMPVVALLTVIVY